MATNTDQSATSTVNALSEQTNSSEQSITISDPVKVTIQVVKASADQNVKENTESSSLADNINNLVGIVNEFASNNQQTVTINDPVKVTITVVQAAASDKQTVSETLVSAANEIQNDLAEKIEQLQQSLDENESPKTEDNPTPEIAICPPVLAPTEEPSTVTGNASEQENKDEKSDSTLLAAAAETGSQEANATAAAATSPQEAAATEETKDVDNALSSAAPSADANNDATKESTSETPAATETSQVETDAQVDEKKEVASVSASTTATSDTIPVAESNLTVEPSNEEAAASASTEVKEESIPTAATQSSDTTGEATATNTNEKEESPIADEDVKKVDAPNSEAAPTSTADNQTEAAVSTTSHECDSTEGVVASSANDEDQLKSTVPVSNATENNTQENTNDFPITKGNAKNLTDFQRQKAEYFFRVNLDKDDKKSLTWDDVESYLLFHADAAGKVGTNDGDLEARLSRAARALWEHIFDQVPTDNGERNQLSVDRFLDTWASLIDYIVKNDQLPTLVQDLVDLGFELYSKKNGDEKASISASSLEQLQKKMSLDATDASEAYKALTENNTKPLDADRVNSLVRAAIASSDEDHPSRYLLPGLKKKPSTAAAEEPSSTTAEKNDQPSNSTDPKSSTTTTPAPEVSSSTKEQTSSPPSNNAVTEITRTAASPQAAPQPTARPPLAQIQALDNAVRDLLRYYHIDDGDLVEVNDGSQRHLVVVHPERPLPAYIKQDKGLVQLLSNGGFLPSPTPAVNQKAADESKTETSKQSDKPKEQENTGKPTLEERVSRGEAQVGPTVPVRPEQDANSTITAGIRQIFPPEQEDQLQSSAPAQTAAAAPPEEKLESDAKTSEKETPSTATEPSKQETPSTATEPSKQETTDITQEEEEKIVQNILKQLTPLVEELVANEVRRLALGSSNSNSEAGFVPFPFMVSALAGGPSFQGSFQGPQTNNGAGINIGGVSGPASNLSPEILMTMMSDLARDNLGANAPRGTGGVPRPPNNSRAPTGVEGFMMFVDDNSHMAGQMRSGPRF